MPKFFFAFALAAACLCIYGCNENKQEPFKEWWADEKYEDYVPPTAQIVAEGPGPIEYTTQVHGTLYLLDMDDMRQIKEMATPHVVMTGSPVPGSTIRFDPSNATLTRGGTKSQKLTKAPIGHRYQFRWQPLEKK